MPGILGSVHVTNFLGLVLFLVLWIVLCELAHVLVMILRRDPLIGWAVSPFGITVMFLHEPSLLSIWLNVLCPALVSGSILSIGLYTSLSPISFSTQPLAQFLLLVGGVLVSSLGNLVNALRDLRYPLWGEARILRTIQDLRATWAKIHFTSFGHSYLLSHFGFNPTELLRVF